MKVVLATRNRGKIREIRSILSGLDVSLLDLEDFEAVGELDEIGETYLENALSKARTVYEKTGYPALADDSGLEVEALGGAPGVLSARFGGPFCSDADRCIKLLEELKEVPDERRGARFRCVAVLYPSPRCLGRALWTEGLLYGRIAREPKGDNGFGYDPIFLLPRLSRTLAELDVAQKNSVSHRYRAFIEMKYLLAREFGVAMHGSMAGQVE